MKRIVVVGATGMVGGYALRYALEDPAVGEVTSIGRRAIGIAHPKLREVLHRDFGDCSALAPALSGQDAAVFCLGTYTGAVPDAELRKTTVDYPIEFARVLHDCSPGATFAFLSGSGADPPVRAGFPSHGTREKPKRRSSLRDFRTCTSFAPRTSIRWSHGRSRTSPIVCCAPSIPYFAFSFRTRWFEPTTWRASW